MIAAAAEMAREVYEYAVFWFIMGVAAYALLQLVVSYLLSRPRRVVMPRSYYDICTDCTLIRKPEVS